MLKKVRWNMFLSQELLDQTKALAARKGVSTSDVVRTAVGKYLAAVQKAEAARADAVN